MTKNPSLFSFRIFFAKCLPGFGELLPQEQGDFDFLIFLTVSQFILGQVELLSQIHASGMISTMPRQKQLRGDLDAKMETLIN